MNEINKEKLIEYIVNLQQEDGSKKNENYFFFIKTFIFKFFKGFSGDNWGKYYCVS